MKKLKVVAAVIRNDKNEYLCALRSPAMSMPNLWEFPGGKIETDETPEESLKREIREELNCEIKVNHLIKDIVHTYSTVVVNLLTFNAEIVNGEPVAKEHSKIVWLPLDKMNQLEWAPADIPTVEKLLQKENSHKYKS